MSKILAQGMITLTQLYEGAQVILTPTAVLIPCDSKETPKSNAYTNAFTNVRAFLGTMDITSKITLGTLEYSDSTVRASKSGTKVSITAITTRTGYVDIPVSVAIDGETINLGKHRFSFVKQIDGQTGQPGQPGIPGDPGFSYTLNIKGGTRGIAYAANGTNPEPKTSSQFSVELLKNGVKIANPASISWTCGGNLSGSSSAATFTPTIKSTYNSESSYVKVSVKEFAASLAVEETIPIVCTKHADGLDWINEWNNKYVQVGTEKIITPKIFAGTKSSANELTGVAIGRDVLGGNANKVIGIVGYKKNTPVFSLDQDANFFVSSSGSAGDIKNGTNNAKGIYFDGNNLYVSGKVKISGGSTIGESNTLVEDVINNSNLGAQANNKLDNLSIGGRNLAQKTSNIYSTPFTDFNGGTNKVVMITNKVLTDGLAVGDMVSVRLVYKYDNIVAAVDNTTTPATTKTAAAWIQGSGNVTSWDSGSFYSSPKKTLSGSGEHIFSYSFKMTSNHLKNDYWSINIRHDNVQSGSVQFKMFKVEKGSMPTDWTPAPEDLENAYTIILTNEAQVIPTDSSRKPTSSVTYSTDIQVYKGSTQRTDYTIGTINSANGITVSKTSSRVNFAVSTGTALTADGGYFTIPIAIDGKTFNKTFSWSCSKQGVKGDTGATGNGISGITEYYAVSSSNTTAPTSWSTTVPAMTATNKYLWNYETITYSNNTTTNTLKRVIGVYGDKGNTGNTGATGNGISGITNYYLASPKSSGITTSTSGWTTSVQSVSSSKKYLWNYEAVAYTNGLTNTTTPCIIGVYGDKGDNAKTVSLTSSSQVFKSTDGGLTFAPDNIVITPNYQNVSYSKWQYSTNGGNSWTDVSSSTNGVTYSSTSLTLSKTSTLFTNTATSIIFKIITNNSSVTDTITIVKLYDVTDLQIGGRNLIRKGDLAQNNSTATYDGATNTWTVNAIAGAGGTWGCGLVVKNGNALVPYGKAYVLSFEIKVPRACSWNCDVNNYASTGSNWAGNDNDNTSKRTTSSKSLVANQWIKCWIKWENTNSNNTNKVDIYDNTNFGVVMKDETSNMTYQIRNVKGELGNVPTEWTPAPEDVDAEISAVNNKAQDSINKLTELASDSKLTASEKLVVKREWDAIVGEKTKIISEANKFGVSKTDYESKYNTLNSYITPLLSNLTTTSDINGSTFRSNFTNYYNSRQDLLNAITTKVKTLADNAQSTANTANNTANTVNTTVNNNKNNWSNAYNRVVEWARGAVTGSTDIDGGMIATDTITAKQMAIGDFNNYSQLAKGKNLVNRHGTANWTEGTNGHSYWQTTNAYFPFTVNETLNPFKAGDKIQIKFDAYTPSTRNVNVGVWFYSDTSANSNTGSITGTVSCSASWGTKTVNLTLPTGNTYVQNAKSIAILIQNGSSGERIEVRNVTVNRLVAGDLIVNGTITTDHIHTNGLNANVIKAGTISADRLDANTIVSKVNGGTTEINGNRIQTGTLSASKITTGTLDANKVNITNIKAGNIVSGTIDASKISVTNLNASNITSGTLRGGGYNLLRNSGFKNEKNYWSVQKHNNPTEGIFELISSSATWGYPDASVKTAQIKLSNQSNIEYGIAQNFNTTIGKQYTLTFQYAGHRISGANVIIRGANGSWLANKYFTPTSFNGGNGNVNQWGTCSLTFTATTTSHTLNIVINTAQNNGYLWVAKPQIVEGAMTLPYSPHPSEIYEGSTVIDASGITVNNGALRVKDGSGNTMLEGDSSGTLYLRKQLNVGTIGTFSSSGVNITGGSFSVSGGSPYKESSTGYVEGSTTSQRLYTNGLFGSSSVTSGSQTSRSDSFYGSNGWSIYENNSANATQQSFKSYSRGSGIYIQATETDKASANVGKLVEKTRLNHEGLRTTGSITASKGVNADTLNSRTLRSSANTNNRIDLQSHNNDMWFRSTSEYFTFQCGTGGDNWTQSFAIRGVNSPADGQNKNWIDIGQMKSNASNGSYRGVSIRKFENGGAVPGDLVAGRYYLSGAESAYLTNYSNTGVKIQSPHGYCAIGPQNGSYCHYVTDRPTHWFDRNVAVQGEIRCGSGYNQLVPYGLMSNEYDNGTGEVCEGRIHIGGNKYIYYGWCSVHATAGTSAERTYTVPDLKRIRGITIQCYTRGGTGNFGELALKQTYSNGFTFRIYNATNTGTHYITYMIIGE